MGLAQAHALDDLAAKLRAQSGQGAVGRLDVAGRRAVVAQKKAELLDAGFLAVGGQRELSDAGGKIEALQAKANKVRERQRVESGLGGFNAFDERRVTLQLHMQLKGDEFVV